MGKDWIKNSVIVMLVLLAAFSRLIPHPNNFTAVGALAIFGAVTIPNKWMSSIVPLFAMWLSDLFINNVIYASYYETFVWFSPSFFWIYLGVFAHSVSSWLLASKANVTGIAGASALGAILFFLLSNFGVWIGSTMYPQTWEGLVLCFTAAIPFFGNTLAGNLFFSFLLFGSYFLLEKKTSVFQTA